MVVYRLLLHSGEATYNATTKKYIFNLEKRISRPKSMKIVKCNYSNSSGSTHPLVVYAESDNLTRLTKQKHTLKLKSNNHENQTSVLCTLQETHTIGRYDLQGDIRTFETDPDYYIKEVDIFFTNNGTLLPKSSETAQNATGSDDEILNTLGDDLLGFIDFAPARTLSQSFQQLSTAGDIVYYLYNRGPNTSLIFQNSYGAGTQLASIGNHRGVTRSGSWESVIDSTPIDLNTTTVGPDFSVHSLFKLTTLDWCLLWNVGYQKIYIWQQQLAYEDANGAKVGVMQVLPHVDYLLTVSRKTVNQVVNFEWRLERLDTNEVTTAVSGSGLTAPPNANGFSWSFGIASTHFRQLQSCWILHNQTSENYQNISRQWIKNAYNGTTTANSETSESVTQEAEWFIELEIQAET